MIPKEALSLLRFRRGSLYITSHRSDGTARQRVLKIYIQDIVKADSPIHEMIIPPGMRPFKEVDKYTVTLKTVLENHTTQSINVVIPQNGIIRMLFGSIWDICETKEINSTNVTIYKRIVLSKE